MDQLIELALKMPPVVSAFISLVCCFVVWIGGKRIMSKIEKQAEPILTVLAAQSKELKTQSDDLTAIKIQTTKTNGGVITLERVITAHEALDNERHLENVKRLDRNQNTNHTLRDQLSEFAARVGIHLGRKDS